MGRTGKMFAFEHFDFHPDIVALAKGIASGMPLGVMMAHADVMTWEPGAHASTFGGNPVCLAAAMETVRLLEEKYVANSAVVGKFLKERLQRGLVNSPVVGDVRGLGLMIGVEIVKDRDTRDKNPQLRDAIIEESFKRGLLLLGAGPSTIRLSPPLMIDQEQAECGAEILAEAIASCLSRSGSSN